MRFAMGFSQYHHFLDQRSVTEPESCFTVISSWPGYDVAMSDQLTVMSQIETTVLATMI